MSRPLGIVTRAGRSLSPVSRAFIEALCGSVAGQTAAAAAIA
jgi:hypothetical protein